MEYNSESIGASNYCSTSVYAHIERTMFRESMLGRTTRKSLLVQATKIQPVPMDLYLDLKPDALFRFFISGLLNELKGYWPTVALHSCTYIKSLPTKIETIYKKSEECNRF